MNTLAKNFCIIVLLLFSSCLIAAKGKSAELTLRQPAANKKLNLGWIPKLEVSSHLNFSSHSKTIGQTDGDSTTLGFKLNSGLDYRRGANEWRQSLSYNVTSTRSPSLPRFIKSSDLLEFTSLFLHSLESFNWLGPYLRFNAKAPIFKGENIALEPLLYVDRKTATSYGTHHAFRMTDSFKPATINESLGFFAKAIERPNTLLEFRLGIGASQVLAKGQFRIDDDKSTKDQIEVRELENISLIGFEYGWVFKGKWNSQSDYKISGDFLSPVGVSIKPGDVCQECSEVERTSIELKALAQTKINSWASIGYEYKALKQPLILNAFQIFHGVKINIEYQFL